MDTWFNHTSIEGMGDNYRNVIARWSEYPRQRRSLKNQVTGISDLDPSIRRRHNIRGPLLLVHCESQRQELARLKSQRSDLTVS